MNVNILDSNYFKMSLVFVDILKTTKEQMNDYVKEFD